MRLLKFLAVSTVTILAACASPTAPINNPLTSSTQSHQNMDIGERYGLSRGTWKTDCGKSSVETQLIDSDGKTISIRSTSPSGVISNIQIYEFIEISRGLTEVKYKSIDRSGDLVGVMRIGYSGGKRMTFENRILANRRPELILVKEAFEVAQSADGSLRRVKLAPIFIKCD